MNKLKKAATILGVAPAFHDSDTESTSTFENEESDDDDLNALGEEEDFGKYIIDLGKSSEKEEKAAMGRLAKHATAPSNDSDAESAATFENEESDDEDFDEAGFGAYTDPIIATPEALLQGERERKAAEMVAEAVKFAEEAENAAVNAKIAESTARAAVARATSAAGPERAAEAAKVAAQRAAEEATAAANAWENAAASLLTANDYLNAIEDAGKNASAYRAEAALEKVKREYHAADLALEEVKRAIDKAKYSADAATNAEHAAVVFSAEAVKAAESAERTAKEDVDRKKVAERAIEKAASEAAKKQKDKETAKHDKRVQKENEAAMKWIEEESHRRILFAKWKAEQIISDTEYEPDLEIDEEPELEEKFPRKPLVRFS